MGEFLSLRVRGNKNQEIEIDKFIKNNERVIKIIRNSYKEKLEFFHLLSFALRNFADAARLWKETWPTQSTATDPTRISQIISKRSENFDKVEEICNNIYKNIKAEGFLKSLLENKLDTGFELDLKSFFEYSMKIDKIIFPDNNYTDDVLSRLEEINYKLANHYKEAYAPINQ